MKQNKLTCPIPNCNNVFKKKYGFRIVNQRNKSQKQDLCPQCGYQFQKLQVEGLKTELSQAKKELHEFKTAPTTNLVNSGGKSL